VNAASDVEGIISKTKYGKIHALNNPALAKSTKSMASVYIDTVTNLRYTVPDGWNYIDLSAIAGTEDKALMVTNSTYSASILIFSYRCNTTDEARYLGPNECFGQCDYSQYLDPPQIFGYLDTTISNIRWAYISYQDGFELTRVSIVFTASFDRYTHVCVYGTTVSDYNINSDVYFEHWENCDFISLTPSSNQLLSKRSQVGSTKVYKSRNAIHINSPDITGEIKVALYDLLGKRILAKGMSNHTGSMVIPLRTRLPMPNVIRIESETSDKAFKLVR